ncbi:uncharacterized protein EDB93DRAFT_1106643 [Suillus bovinus]|uniref:uncharacterized protein n=1 Tax=Suillus bovinus TaxID=48563 RepID=UPI001B87537F|nr:uncharacterized protein EDB93DRAFT_1106643 [Suillus bovinus]KAG2137451.1 hypothetical protein EDB93DRAFT_1106643 [Suillus bovinus]
MNISKLDTWLKSMKPFTVNGFLTKLATPVNQRAGSSALANHHGLGASSLMKLQQKLIKLQSDKREPIVFGHVYFVSEKTKRHRMVSLLIRHWQCKLASLQASQEQQMTKGPVNSEEYPCHGRHIIFLVSFTTNHMSVFPTELGIIMQSVKSAGALTKEAVGEKNIPVENNPHPLSILMGDKAEYWVNGSGDLLHLKQSRQDKIGTRTFIVFVLGYSVLEGWKDMIPDFLHLFSKV